MTWQSDIVFEDVCVGYILENIRCRILILGRPLSWGCDFDLTFNLPIVTLSIRCCIHYISETVKCGKSILGRYIGWR